MLLRAPASNIDSKQRQESPRYISRLTTSPRFVRFIESVRWPLWVYSGHIYLENWIPWILIGLAEETDTNLRCFGSNHWNEPKTEPANLRFQTLAKNQPNITTFSVPIGGFNRDCSPANRWNLGLITGRRKVCGHRLEWMAEREGFEPSKSY